MNILDDGLDYPLGLDLLMDAMCDGAYAPVTCNRCGKKGLEWSTDGRRWYLVEGDGTTHRCDMTKVALDDFEVIA